MNKKKLRVSAPLVATVLVAGPALADVDLRVESRPQADPIAASIRVSDGGGPVPGLAAGDFVVTLDGTPVGNFDLILPPNQNAPQKVSVVLAFDHDLLPESGVPVVQDAVADFIAQLGIGDASAIVPFKTDVLEPDLSLMIEPFTIIDGGAGTQNLVDAALAFYRGGFLDLYDALNRAVEQFETAPIALPDGPRTIIFIEDAAGLASSSSQSEVLERANARGIPIFTIRVGSIGSFPRSIAMMASFAADSGGAYVEVADASDVTRALADVASMLKDGYRIVIPQTAVIDCDPHVLEVTVLGETADVAFTRCDNTPVPFEFELIDNVASQSVIVSESVTITGVQSPVAVTVFGGEYSIGCGATFTSAPGFLLPEEEICVRHTSGANPGDITETTLIVGGVTAFFLSTTGNPPPPPPVRNGGGAVGIAELLAGFVAVAALRRRRRRAAA